ncbi:hypothetical protein [Rhodococcus qingshengii]|uniref:hypothetical protein n=1 Tax=Rhodococcus qingshengii TaxID=334542 RepID=UPI0035D73603
MTVQSDAGVPCVKDFDIICHHGTVHLRADPKVSSFLSSSCVWDDAGREALEQAEFTHWDDNHTIIIPEVRGTHLPFGEAEAGTDNKGVLIKLVVPPGSSARIRVTDGEIKTEGMFHEVDAKIVNGPIRMHSVKLATARAKRGSISVREVLGRLDAFTGRGKITVRNHRGNSALMETGRGSIRLTVDPSASGRIRATADIGKIHMFGVAERNDLRIKTGGSAEVNKY